MEPPLPFSCLIRSGFRRDDSLQREAVAFCVRPLTHSFQQALPSLSGFALLCLLAMMIFGFTQLTLTTAVRSPVTSLTYPFFSEHGEARLCLISPLYTLSTYSSAACLWAKCLLIACV